MERDDLDQESLQMFSPRELSKLGVLFLTQCFREILEYTVTEQSTKMCSEPLQI